MIDVERSNAACAALDKKQRNFDKVAHRTWDLQLGKGGHSAWLHSLTNDALPGPGRMETEVRGNSG
jgi:hypothetical protein